ncbi:MAG: hypothetical protein DA405_07995 [Bacteroidetes bacterium]|nr:MAG: hypothetical protein DA405_07995 [Bacteroidota bacterium]
MDFYEEMKLTHCKCIGEIKSLNAKKRIATSTLSQKKSIIKFQIMLFLKNTLVFIFEKTRARDCTGKPTGPEAEDLEGKARPAAGGG